RFCHASLILAALGDDKSLLEELLRSRKVLAVLSGLGRQAVQCGTFHHRLVQRSRQGQQLLVDALRLSELTAQLVCPPKLEIELGQVSQRYGPVLLPRRTGRLMRPPHQLPCLFILRNGITRSKHMHRCITGCDTQTGSRVRKSCRQRMLGQFSRRGQCRLEGLERPAMKDPSPALACFGVGPCTYAIVGKEASAALFLQESSRHSVIEGRQGLIVVEISHTTELIKGAAIAQNSRCHTQGKRSLAQPR